MELKTPEELREQMVELGYRFQYGCLEQKSPLSCHSLGQWLRQYKNDKLESMQVAAVTPVGHTCWSHLRVAAFRSGKITVCSMDSALAA